MINTQGADVTNLPQYHPVDPSLAAFNPAQATLGALSAFQTVGSLDQLKAFKQHAAEVAATEGIRTKLLTEQANQAEQHSRMEQLAADRQQALQESGIAAAKAQFDQTAKVTPLQTTLQSGAINGQINALPAVNSALLNNARLGAATSAGALQLEPQQHAIEQQKLDAIQRGLTSQDEIAPLQHKVDVANLNDLISNNQTDAGLKRQAIQAKIGLDKHLGEYYDAHGQFMKGQGRQTGAKIDPNKAIENYSNALQKIDATIIGGTRDNPVRLSDYEEQKENPDTGFLGSGIGAKKFRQNSTAEALISQRNILQGALVNATKRLAAGETGTEPITPSAQDNAGVLSDDQALSYAKSHPEDPNSAAVLALHGIK